MAFELIPAIDVLAGRLARYTASGPEPETARDGDPLRAARTFLDAGARWLHVVDLDLAFRGRQANLDVIRAVTASGGLVQAAGGIVEGSEVDAAVGAGASRVVLGSAALLDLDRLTTELARLGDRGAVGIEVDDGRVRARGLRSAELSLDDALRAAVGAGAACLLVTGTGRVGTLSGPGVGAIARAVTTGVPVIAAGGIGSVEHLTRVRDLGAVGAVIGRAALEGTIDLEAAYRSLD